MHNYRIHCDVSERAEVLSIVRKYNDIIIDNVDDHSVGITIQSDDAEAFFERLLDEIDASVSRRRREQIHR
jgi:hypothetical protein